MLGSLDTGTAEVVEDVACMGHNADSEGLELHAGSVVRKLDAPVLSSHLMVALHGSLQYLKHTKIHFDINLLSFKATTFPNLIVMYTIFYIKHHYLAQVVYGPLGALPPQQVRSSEEASLQQPTFPPVPAGGPSVRLPGTRRDDSLDSAPGDLVDPRHNCHL